MREYFVYISASKKDGVLYIGITNDLRKRIYQHKNEFVGGFTKKYHVRRLVYFEIVDNIYSALTREKQLKKWKRQWKIELIEKDNPEWKDLYDELA